MAGKQPGVVPNRFSFLHTYEKTGCYWRGLEKSGLIRPHTGVRLVCSPFSDNPSRDFNQVARKDGELFRLISTRKCPFILTVLVGGGEFHPCDFDPLLMKEYEKFLGEKFLGAQMHEVALNTTNDWLQLSRANPECIGTPLNENAQPVGFQQGKLADYVGRRFPQTVEERWAETLQSFRRHKGHCASLFTVCEGSEMGELTWHTLYKEGARCCLAEVGPWLSPNAQFSIAALRGAAKSAGRPWGVYFSSWGGVTGGTCFTPEKQNSWGYFRPHDSWPTLPEAGPSGALQRRVWFYTYLSGAQILTDEWGAECHLLDWDTGELSSYGKVTRDLLDFQESNPDVGIPFTPVALVLDAEVVPPTDLFRESFWDERRELYPPRSLDIAWTGLLRALFGYDTCYRFDAKTAPQFNYDNQYAGWAGKSEEVCLSPCDFPAIFDVVPSDASEHIWSHYQKVIAIGANTSAPACALRYPVEQQFRRVSDAIAEYSPFWRVTDLTMQVNYRQTDGAWIVGFFNPRGARRGDVWNTGSVLNEAFTVKEILHPKFSVRSGRLLHAWPESTVLEQRGNDLYVTVGAGGTAILEVIPVERDKVKTDS